MITDKKFSENALKNDVSKFEIKKEAMGFVDEIKNLRSI